VSPYRLQYGGFYDTERGLGAIADLTNRNTLGNAAVLGVRARYDDTFREGRLYFGQPQLGGLPFDSNAAAFVSREIRPSAGFISDRIGFSVQQEKVIRQQFVLSWGYRFERDHTYDPADPFFDLTLKVAPLTANFSRDVRDDILDASRGSFMSHNLEYAPRLLGSDLKFIRYFGQYSHYVPLSQPEEIPWSGGLRKSRLVYAGGVRLGLGHGFEDQRLVPSERFYAGGGTSIRGFEQDQIGPRDFIGDPAGGQSLFVMNHELRFPLYHIVDGVGFFDLGNVYRDVRDLDLFDVRYSSGIGLRIRTPYFLLRGDLGFNLFPREGEKRSAFFFSIGQAF
jgi:outer membrane protein assembly factor BamA